LVVATISACILGCVGFIGTLVFYIAAAADYEFDSEAIEEHRALVLGMLERSILVWLLPGGVALAMLWLPLTRFIPPWLILTALVIGYGGLSYLLIVGIWPQVP
jgi:hypothetical protein